MTTAALASTNVSSPSLPGSYTLKRRIGSFLTDTSAHIIAFIQNGNEFLWLTPINNFSTNISTPVTITLTVPTGVVVWGKIRAQGSAGGSSAVLFFPTATPSLTALTPAGNAQLAGANTWSAAGEFNIQTNTSAQISASLQNHVKALDQILHNMADIDDMVDELTDAAKKAGGDDRDAKAHRQARAYKLTQIVLTAAMQQQRLVEEQMAIFLESAPDLERRVARWRSDG